MNILAYIRRNSGPCYHRIITPMMLMPDDVMVFATNDLQEQHFAERKPDVFVYNRIIPDEALEKINEFREQYGFKICVDIDDIWELDSHHILHEVYKDNDYASQQIRHIRNADFVTVTHERLAEEVKPFNKNVHILPNAIPKTGQFIETERTPSKHARLFWQGSITHRADLEMIAAPILRLADIAENIEMVMAGFESTEQEWHHMADIFTGRQQHRYNILPGQPVTDYYKAYAEADICLIPLLATRFNSMKSNLKVLEAANLGLPVICSNVHPYKGLPVIYANNGHEWVMAIKRLAASRKRQREVGAVLKEFCDKHFNFEKINRERRKIYEFYGSVSKVARTVC